MPAACRRDRRTPRGRARGFPELYLGGYDLSRSRRRLGPSDCDEGPAGRRQRPPLDRGGRRLRRAPIEGGRIANSVVCFDTDGTLAGVYRKTQLFAGEARLRARRRADDRAACRHRRRRPICFDVEFPEPARALACAGAEAFRHVVREHAPVHGRPRARNPARALETNFPHLYANAVGCRADCSSSVTPLGRRGWRRALRGPTTTRRSSSYRSGPRSGDDRIDYLRHLPRLCASSPTDSSPVSLHGDRGGSILGAVAADDGPGDIPPTRELGLV